MSRLLLRKVYHVFRFSSTPFGQNRKFVKISYVIFGKKML